MSTVSVREEGIIAELAALPLQKSGQRPWIVHLSLGSTWPSHSRPVYVFQNCVASYPPIPSNTLGVSRDQKRLFTR